MARDQWADEILNSWTYFGRGITGWAVQHREPVLANEAHLDPRVEIVPGTPLEPEAFICVPLIARGSVKGALNIYRIGEEAMFTEEEFELVQRVGDAAALALDNAEIRAALEHQAQTDSLTGLYNHRYFHERLRSELTRASRSEDSVALLMIDLDDFKQVNDVHGHAVGDLVLSAHAEMMKATVRASDVACRIGGEEFAVIMPSCDAGDALGLATRLSERLAEVDFDPAGKVTVSIGVSQGPQHAMNPRELVACAEAAMMTAKVRGKDRIVLFEEEGTERPEGSPGRDVRSIAHLKMLQSLAGKLNRLNEIKQIGDVIVSELRTLIDYHSCRVYITEGEDLLPVSFRGELAYAGETPEDLAVKIGEGITGHAAATRKSLLIEDALDCEFAVDLPGTSDIHESMIAVPLTYGVRVTGVIVISKLGANQFDGDDVRLIEVLAGHVSVALENARLYEAQRREARNARRLLEYADRVSKAPSIHAISQETVVTAIELLDANQASLWLENEQTGDFRCASHTGYVGHPEAEELIRTRMTEKQADMLVGDRKAPFILTPEGVAEQFGIDVDPAFRTSAVAPLQRGDGLKGWIVVRQPNKEGLFFTEERLRLLAGLSYQSSVAMQKAILYREQKESAEIANSLLDFSRELATTEGLDEILVKIVELAARILGAPKTSVWLQDPITSELAAREFWGYTDIERTKIVKVRIPPHEVRSMLEGDEPFVLTPEEMAGFQETTEVTGDLVFAVAPLRIDSQRHGCLFAAAPAYGDYEFSDRKMRLVAGIAHQAQLAIANAGSFDSLEQTFFSTVEALANALEAKDEYTSEHARSITDMSLEVGARLGMSQKELKRLELGALFHDIGKIGIPSEILLKPGPLTDEEWQVMKTHPELGERIIKPIHRLADVCPIVRACHERFDGKGYPDGLSGEDVPIESRIILVCDAFDAMTTDRPYRKRLHVEEACKRLRESAGTQFDPQVVDIFLNLVEETPGFAA
jgi:diguanylate cyclase (GGDEF)-like protein